MSTIDFATRFIHPESGVYPLNFTDIKARHPNTSFPSDPSAELMQNLGYFVVKPVVAPEGDVVTESDPFLEEDGSYSQTYQSRPFNEEELVAGMQVRQNELLSKISELKMAALEKGVPVDFGGDYGVKHIQLRDGDRANIIGLRLKAEGILAGKLTGITGVRTYENVFVPVTAEQMVDIGWKVMAAYEEIMGTAWHFEDLVNAADKVSELPALPPSFTPTQQSLLAV